MTSRWRPITSSYLRTFLRDSKFCDSIWPWALAIASVTRLFSIGTSSGTLRTVRMRSTQSDLNRRISSSCERQVEPGLARVALTAGTTAQLVVDAARLVALGADDVEAAEVPDLVVLGRDLRLDPLDHGGPGGVVLLGGLDRARGPACAAPASARKSTEPPSMMSVPRPAMLVATVTAPLWPASATIFASSACCLALRTVCGMPRLRSRSERCSDFSTETVPTRIGWPFSWRSAMSSTTASYLASSVR